MDHQESIDLSCSRPNAADLSLVFGSPRVYQKTVRSSISSNHQQPMGLTMSIAEKPKSQEVPLHSVYEQFIGNDTPNKKSWQGTSNQAQCSFLPPMNDFSEHCHMNTFANKE